MFLPKWSLAPWVSVDFPRLIKALSGRELQEILLEAHVPRDALGKSVRSVGKKPMEHVFFSMEQHGIWRIGIGFLGFLGLLDGNFFELQFAKHPIQNIRDTGFPWECYNAGWFPIIVLDFRFAEGDCFVPFVKPTRGKSKGTICFTFADHLKQIPAMIGGI